MKQIKRPIQRIVDYWFRHYVNAECGLCSLCGNAGTIDTRCTAISAAGVSAGRINYCICPNGQMLRAVNKNQSPDTVHVEFLRDQHALTQR